MKMGVGPSLTLGHDTLSETPTARFPVSTALALSYVLPLHSEHVVQELTTYLHSIALHVEVIVVDGSPDAVFEEHHRQWRDVIHIRPDERWDFPFRKVTGVLTGLGRATQRRVVIADDDVRWTPELLASAGDRLGDKAVLRPQNYFKPHRWHTRWDTGRILLNRLFGGDWPGTLVVDRNLLLATGGYDGSAMFENLELVRTLKAAGGHEVLALDLLIPRTPPDVRQFLDQRVRQAFDEFARPWRLLLELAVLPAVIVGRRRAAIALAAASIGFAELGRRRGNGSSVFGRFDAVWAPAWVAERSITAWLAVWAKARRGGVSYRGTVIGKAATAPRRFRVAAAISSPS